MTRGNGSPGRCPHCVARDSGGSPVTTHVCEPARVDLDEAEQLARDAVGVDTGGRFRPLRDLVPALIAEVRALRDVADAARVLLGAIGPNFRCPECGKTYGDRPCINRHSKLPCCTESLTGVDLGPYADSVSAALRKAGYDV